MEPLDHPCEWPPPDSVNSPCPSGHISVPFFSLCLWCVCLQMEECGESQDSSGCRTSHVIVCRGCVLAEDLNWCSTLIWNTSSKSNTSSFLVEKCLLLKAGCFTEPCVLSYKCHQEHCSRPGWVLCCWEKSAATVLYIAKHRAAFARWKIWPQGKPFWNWVCVSHRLAAGYFEVCPPSGYVLVIYL